MLKKRNITIFFPLSQFTVARYAFFSNSYPSIYKTADPDKSDADTEHLKETEKITFDTV